MKRQRIAGLVVSICFLLVTNIALNAKAAGAQLLEDSGFEYSASNGTFPSSGKWQPAWLGEAGAVCTITAAHSGNNGLWQYTGASSFHWWSGPYQEFPASVGQTFEALAYIRTPSGAEWVNGASARVRLEFRSNSDVIQFYESPTINQANQDWQLKSTGQKIAPSGTTKVRFVCYLKKPNTASGIAVANFDDCSLERIESAPILAVSPPVLGFGNNKTSLTFEISNAGAGALSWSISGQDNWIILSNISGDLTTTPKVITVQINRALLPRFSSVDSLTVSSNGGNGTVKIMAEKAPSQSVPNQPSYVRVAGRQLLVKKRDWNGQLLSEKPYVICGVCWSPASVGTLSDRNSRQAEFAKWKDLDVQLMYEMNGNTVYTFLDFGTGFNATAILDYLYANNIMAIVTVDWDGTDDTNRIQTIVNAYKNHPAILMWAIGNEWNLWRPDRPKYYHRYATLSEAAAAMQANTLQIKSLDTNHPVCSILGEINYPTQGDVNNIVSNICTAVDVWGANIYRGPEFYAFFTEWASMSTKPIFLSEFGTDAFHTTSWWPPVGYEDEIMQADFVRSLWTDLAEELSAINPSKVCLGGTVFEWNDEWWKSSTGDRYVQEPDGYETTWNPIAHPDGFANEEYFGIFRIDRTERAVFQPLKNFFSEFSQTRNSVNNWQLYQ